MIQTSWKNVSRQLYGNLFHLSLTKKWIWSPRFLRTHLRNHPFYWVKMLIFVNFIIEAHTFHIEEYFENMEWVLIVTIEENAYPHLMKEFCQHMKISPWSDEISCLLKNVHITIMKELIRDILELEPCNLQIFSKASVLLIVSFPFQWMQFGHL